MKGKLVKLVLASLLALAIAVPSLQQHTATATTSNTLAVPVSAFPTRHMHVFYYGMVGRAAYEKQWHLLPPNSFVEGFIGISVGKLNLNHNHTVFAIVSARFDNAADAKAGFDYATAGIAGTIRTDPDGHPSGVWTRANRWLGWDPNAHIYGYILVAQKGPIEVEAIVAHRQRVSHSGKWHRRMLADIISLFAQAAPGPGAILVWERSLDTGKMVMGPQRD